MWALAERAWQHTCSQGTLFGLKQRQQRPRVDDPHNDVEICIVLQNDKTPLSSECRWTLISPVAREPSAAEIEQVAL